MEYLHPASRTDGGRQSSRAEPRGDRRPPANRVFDSAKPVKQKNEAEMVAQGRILRFGRVPYREGFNFAGCEHCDDSTPPGLKGWTDPDGTIHLCANRMPSCEYVKIMLSHELWHAYDFCQQNVPPDSSCCDCVCYELRAYRWDGGCRDGGPRRQRPGPRGEPPPATEEECLRMYVGLSCSSEGYPCAGKPEEMAKCFTEMYSKSECYPHSVAPIRAPAPIVEH